MAKTYVKADDSVMSIVRQVIGTWKQELKDAGVDVGVVMVTTDDDTPPLSSHGHSAAARIRIVKPRERCFMKIDAMIEVDGNQWPEWSEKRRIAVIDHELTHLVVKYDKNGNIKQYADLRPVLGLCSDDWRITGFKEIVERHGPDAMEAQTLSDVMAWCGGQALFPWGEKKADKKKSDAA